MTAAPELRRATAGRPAARSAAAGDVAVLLEDLQDRALPARVEDRAQGWLLRWSGGADRRSDSARPLPPMHPGRLVAGLGEVERFYAGRGLRATVSLARPAYDDLLPALRSAGWLRCDVTRLVKTAPIDHIATSPAALDVSITDGCDTAWLGVVAGVGYRLARDRDAAVALFSGVSLPAAYALVRGPDGDPVAAGRAVADDDWVGLFNIATSPHARRRGHARAVVTALARWGAEHGARRAYLRVAETNLVARALYRQLGFATSYSAEFWRAPA